jgi:FKBP-type peptidyl-prolyl cis-trans isomerase
MKTLARSIGVLFLLAVVPVLAFGQDFKRTESGLQYRTVRVGTGPVAKVGQLATIHEIMKRQDGTVITDTYAYNMTPQFEIGGNQAIKGLDEGVAGMRVGEIREFIVPPALSQRKFYPANLPPNDVLHYEVLLVKLTDKKPAETAPTAAARQVP